MLKFSLNLMNIVYNVIGRKLKSHISSMEDINKNRYNS